MMETLTGVCEKCDQSFIYTARSRKGRPRQYCDKHQAEVRRQKTRDRVAVYRERAKGKMLKARPRIIHVFAVYLDRTYCGTRPNTADEIQWLKDHPTAPRRACKKCAAIYDRLLELSA